MKKIINSKDDHLSEFEIHSFLYERLMKNRLIANRFHVRGNYEVLFEDYQSCIFDIAFLERGSSRIALVVEVKTKKKQKSGKQKRKYFECVGEDKVFYVKGMDEACMAEAKIERLLNV